MADRLQIRFSVQARAELAELDEKERAKVLRHVEDFMALVPIPGGKAEQLRPAGPQSPSVSEFKVNAKDHWIRLLFTTAQGSRIVLVCMVKKTNRVRDADIELAIARAKSLGL